MGQDLDERINNFAELLYRSRYPVFFTGAGMSTESGLSDFRGPDGMWTRRDKGLLAKPIKQPWDTVDPNNGHFAIVELQKIGKLQYLISQNVDNLHLKSGIPPELLAELHGNITKLRCSICGDKMIRSTRKKICHCGGNLFPSVVDFGQLLPERDLNLSFKHSRKCDLFTVMGSSLVVSPAANMPQEALLSGAKLVIINDGVTPFDAHAHSRFNEKIGAVLPRAVKRLKHLMGLFE